MHTFGDRHRGAGGDVRARFVHVLEKTLWLRVRGFIDWRFLQLVLPVPGEVDTPGPRDGHPIDGETMDEPSESVARYLHGSSGIRGDSSVQESEGSSR